MNRFALHPMRKKKQLSHIAKLCRKSQSPKEWKKRQSKNNRKEKQRRNIKNRRRQIQAQWRHQPPLNRSYRMILRSTV